MTGKFAVGNIEMSNKMTSYMMDQEVLVIRTKIKHFVCECNHLTVSESVLHRRTV
jgi:hypothetical protein